MSMLSNAYDLERRLWIDNGAGICIEATGVYDINTGCLVEVIVPGPNGTRIKRTVEGTDYAVNYLAPGGDGSWMAPLDDETFDRLRAELAASQREDYR
jgi:hypothetical protein